MSCRACDPLEVDEGGVRNARLTATRHVERVDTLEVDERASVMPAWSHPHMSGVYPLKVNERGVRDACLAAIAHDERVDALKVRKVGVDDLIVA